MFSSRYMTCTLRTRSFSTDTPTTCSPLAVAPIGPVPQNPLVLYVLICLDVRFSCFSLWSVSYKFRKFCNLSYASTLDVDLLHFRQ